MEIKKLLFCAFLLMNSPQLFSFSESPVAEKEKVPLLSEKEQKQLGVFTKPSVPNPLSAAISLNVGDNYMPLDQRKRIIEYLLTTQPELVNKTHGVSKITPIMTAARTIDRIYNKEDNVVDGSTVGDIANYYAGLIMRLLNLTKKENLTQKKLDELLSSAFEANNADLIKELLARGAVPSKDALVTATEGNNIEIMQLLLKPGRPVNDANDFGTRAIQVFKSLEAFNLLVNAGADLKYIVDDELPVNEAVSYAWLDRQIEIKLNDKNFDPKLIAIVLEKLNETGNLKNIQKSLSLCSALAIIASPEKAEGYRVIAESKNLSDQEKEERLRAYVLKARQVANILIQYGAECDDPKYKEILAPLIKERSDAVRSALFGENQPGPLPIAALSDLVLQYLPGHLKGSPRTEEETKTESAQKTADTPTASGSAVAKDESVQGLDDVEQ